MIAAQRQAEILRLLGDTGTARISDLSDRLGVSLETVRRDVKILVSDGSVVRRHGGIMLPTALREAPFDRRMRENATAKRLIARLMARTIGDGESVMLDTGSTTSFLARELLERRRLTVVTNSPDIARLLATVNGNAVHMAGGALDSDSGAALGLSAIEFVSRFWVDHAVISAGALHGARGIMDYRLEEAEFARAVLSRGARRVVVCDASKFDRPGLVQVCGWEGIETLVTDRPPPAEARAALDAAGVRLLLPERRAEG
ncbi:DeoR/GlpR family DNA-binding transcription regulator [Rubellimicrobium sp. CFH 75288]|uniref:DeoR/GlpR family DNA-binding transcription regulator n=1 Tax=Rubellimicrobium sp. CFH 75288 TaxID=2697034 RepID=UPI001411F174|nr:DeoR/GlpR family DNA-binding transcription regulator [Rubellimicrobium sp. CFH 75288]NAZ36572.1 DeoR family transcriptional regulator [Rubellimicrobium sp. CFH 75288]